MRIEILDQAELDLLEGFRFYKAQQGGLGIYFLDNLYSRGSSGASQNL